MLQGFKLGSWSEFSYKNANRKWKQAKGKDKNTLFFLLFKYSKLISFLKELDSKIEDAEKNLGDTEIRESNLTKAEYLSLIGDKEQSLNQFRKTYEKTATLGQKLDMIFHQIRIGFFYIDYDIINRNLEKAKRYFYESKSLSCLIIKFPYFNFNLIHILGQFNLKTHFLNMFIIYII